MFLELVGLDIDQSWGREPGWFWQQNPDERERLWSWYWWTRGGRRGSHKGDKRPDPKAPRR